MTHDRDDDRQTLDASTLDTLLLEASALMKEGLRLIDEARPEAIAEAVNCFDRALAIRGRLPIDEFPVLRYDLAACWLNRGEALVRLGGDERIIAALQAYDEAIGLLRAVPLEDDPRYARRLAIACQNRGLLLHAQGEAYADAAIASLTEGIAVLDGHGSLVPDRQHLLATIWMNLANVRIADGRAPDESWTLGRRAATEAIAVIRDLETEDADAADIGLRARHVLCRALAATCLQAPPATDAPADDATDASTNAPTDAPRDATADDVHEATDLADEALALVQHWEQRGVTRFRDLACDFFRFGAHVYARYQPHFLQEFIHDQLNPAQVSADYVDSPEMRAAWQDVAQHLKQVTYYVTLTNETN
jgi:tetratricopeptide (TPR) repeat protein